MKNWIVYIGFFVAFMACRSEELTENNSDDLKLRLEQLAIQIDNVININCDITCFDLSECGCNTIALGTKPCGGPWDYLIFNAFSTDVDQLKNLVDEYNLVNEQYNEQEGLISDCMYLTSPDVACVANLCQVVNH